MNNNRRRMNCGLVSGVMGALMLLCAATAHAQMLGLSNAERYVYTNGMMGKDFWVVVPPNGDGELSGGDLVLTIEAPERTAVVVDDGRLRADYVAPRTLRSQANGTSWDWEVRTAGEVVLPRKAIHVTAANLVSVSLMSLRELSGEGTMILPTSEWDTSYIVTSYYDFNEVRRWSSGFCVVAGEDNTTVTITLRGVGGNAAVTSGGRRPGDTWTVTMNAGDVYCVQGAAETRGTVDFTGTSVTATKKIGVMNYHMRTAIPAALPNTTGRDNLMEMATPVSQWGTMYATVGHPRKPSNATNGDVYRVVASEPNTSWSMQHYDLQTNQLLDDTSGVLERAGDMFEYTAQNTITPLPHGVTLWKADKPIQVVQYSASASFDGDVMYDPSQINLVPLDRAPKAAVVHTTADASFSKRVVSLVASVDPSEPDPAEALRTILVGTTPLWSHPNSVNGSILDHKVSEGIYWATLVFDINEAIVPVITGNGRVRLTGYSTGHATSRGFAVATGGQTRLLSSGTIDTAAPQMSITESISQTAVIRVTETFTAAAAAGLPAQADVGIARVAVLDIPQNLTLLQDTVTISEDGLVRERLLLFQRQDSTRFSSARIAAVDRAGNVRYLDYNWTPPKRVRYTMTNVRTLGPVRVGERICATQQPQLRAQGDTNLIITEIRVDSSADVFSIDATRCPMPIVLQPARDYVLQCLCATPNVADTIAGKITIISNASTPEATFTVYVIGTTASHVDEASQGSIRAYHNGSSIVLDVPPSTSHAWVYDARGQCVYAMPTDAATDRVYVPASHLAAGLYIVRVHAAGAVHHARVVVE